MRCFCDEVHEYDDKYLHSGNSRTSAAPPHTAVLTQWTTAVPHNFRQIPGYLCYLKNKRVPHNPPPPSPPSCLTRSIGIPCRVASTGHRKFYYWYPGASQQQGGATRVPGRAHRMEASLSPPTAAEEAQTATPPPPATTAAAAAVPAAALGQGGVQVGAGGGVAGDRTMTASVAGVLTRLVSAAVPEIVRAAKVFVWFCACIFPCRTFCSTARRARREGGLLRAAVDLSVWLGHSKRG